MKSIKWIFAYVKKYKVKYTFSLLLVLLCAAINMVNPYLTGKIVDDVIMKGMHDKLLMILAIMIGTTVVKAVIRFIYQMNFERVSQDVIYSVRQDMYDKLQKLDLDYYNKTRTGDIMARMTGDMNAVRHFIAWVLYNIVENSAVFLCAVVTMFIINAKFTLCMLAVTPIILFTGKKLGEKVGPVFFKIREEFSKLNTVVQENISGNRVVKAFAKEDYEISKFEERNKSYMDTNMELANIIKTYEPVLHVLSSLFTVVLLFIGGSFVIHGSMTMGQLVMFNSLIWALNNPMNMMGMLINDTNRFIASSRKMIILSNEDPKIKNPENGYKKDKINGNIEFKNVSFEYDYEPVLKDISFTVKKGQTVALFGATGAGKSTVINLIERFYDASSGEILIDGVDIKKYDLPTLRRDISISMQDVFLFSNSIEENISYGVSDSDEEKIEWAAEMADANGFIRKLSDSYDTIVGERGVGLSGGQKQRITLARSIIKDPAILIFDDTTSSLDVETEAMIQKNLKDIYNDKTTFIIAHRISSIKNADLILVIDNGEIVERGTHDELLAKKGKYYDVYNAQYGDYLEEKNFEEVK